MAVRLTAGVRQQVPTARHGNIEAWCQIEVELPATVRLDGQEFLDEARRLYAVCSQAVEEQLSWREGSPCRQNGRRRGR